MQVQNFGTMKNFSKVSVLLLSVLLTSTKSSAQIVLQQEDGGVKASFEHFADPADAESRQVKTVEFRALYKNGEPMGVSSSLALYTLSGKNIRKAEYKRKVLDEVSRDERLKEIDFPKSFLTSPSNVTFHKTWKWSEMAFTPVPSITDLTNFSDSVAIYQDSAETILRIDRLHKQRIAPYKVMGNTLTVTQFHESLYFNSAKPKLYLSDLTNVYSEFVMTKNADTILTREIILPLEIGASLTTSTAPENLSEAYASMPTADAQMQTYITEIMQALK